MIKQFLIGCLFANFMITAVKAQQTHITEKPVEVKIMLDKTIGDMYPMWAWFGYDEPNYTYMKDGKKLLTELATLSSTPVYIRAHSLLVSGDGVAALKWGSTNAYTEDASGKPQYDWTIVDRIIDTYHAR